MNNYLYICLPYYFRFLEEPNSFAIKKLYDELGLNNNFVGSKFLTIFIILIMCGKTFVNLIDKILKLIQLYGV